MQKYWFSYLILKKFSALDFLIIFQYKYNYNLLLLWKVIEMQRTVTSINRLILIVKEAERIAMIGKHALNSWRQKIPTAIGINTI